MFDYLNRHAVPSPDFSELFRFAVRWTPRAIVAGIAGYYCLGIAYEMGIMAAIDRIAIRILRPSLGYMGMAAIMPTFQWYSACGIRVLAAITAGLLYDLIERVIYAVFSTIFFRPDKETPLFPAPLHRSSPPLSPAPYPPRLSSNLRDSRTGACIWTEEKVSAVE